jgi:hypothetical protein
MLSFLWLASPVNPQELTPSGLLSRDLLRHNTPSKPDITLKFFSLAGHFLQDLKMPTVRVALPSSSVCRTFLASFKPRMARGSESKQTLSM